MVTHETKPSQTLLKRLIAAIVRDDQALNVPYQGGPEERASWSERPVTTTSK